MNKIEIGGVLRQLMLDKNVSGQQVAEAIGKTPGTYSNYLTGDAKPSVEVLVSLADFFEVSTDFILGRKLQKDLPLTNLNEPAIEYGKTIEPDVFMKIVKQLSKENALLEMKLEALNLGDQKNISQTLSVAKLG